MAPGWVVFIRTAHEFSDLKSELVKSMSLRAISYFVEGPVVARLILDSVPGPSG